MPVYEYDCRACGRAFEMLVFASTRPTCPACASEDLEKKFSVTAPIPNPSGQLGADTRGRFVNPHAPGPVCPVSERE